VTLVLSKDTDSPVTGTPPETLVETDLAMGAWSPRHAALEIAAQLGLHLPAPQGAAVDNIISAGVDREAQGDGTLLAAHADARAIVAALPQGAAIRVSRPRFGLPLRADNRALLRYLAGFGATLIFAGRGDAPDWDPLPRLLQIYPGLVPAGVIGAIGVEADHPALTRTIDGRYRIHPAARRSDPQGRPQLADLLARYEVADPRLAAYCQSLGSPLFIDAPALAALAQGAAATSSDLALDLAERARQGARTPIDAATTELQLQGIRIFLHRFDAVARTEDPSIKLPDALRDELLALKGWGLVMTGDPAGANRCFGGRLETALANDNPGPDDLYFLNIAALARLRNGDAAGARTLEERIEAALASVAEPDPQLAFVNAINLARLSRASGEIGQHRRYLARAFATSGTVRSLSEALQLNLLLAGAADSPQAAEFAWLRAALLWLAAEPAEALGIRAARVALGPDPGHARRYDARISALLRARLAEHWTVAPLALGEAPHVVLDPAAAGLVPTSAFATDGVALLWTPDRHPRMPRSTEAAELARAVFGILRSLFPGMPAAESGSWVIDGTCACDVRASPGDARASAWRYRLMQTSARLSLGPAVRALETIEDVLMVRFKRHLEPLVLVGDAARVAARLYAGSVESESLSPAEVEAARDLIDRHVAAVDA